MSMYRHNNRRLLRPTPPEFFPSQDIIAVADGVANIVYFNTRYAGDRNLERRALFMDEQFLRAEENYAPPEQWGTRH